jgi:hypothetical protein
LFVEKKTTIVVVSFVLVKYQVDVPCSVVVVVVDTESVGITRVLVASVVDLSSCL